MDDIRKAAEDASTQLGTAVGEAAEATKQTAASIAGAASQALEEGQKALERSKTLLDEQLDWLKARRDEALAVFNDGLAWAQANPHIAYPAAGGAVLLAVPGTRRFLYRMTFARFVSLESVSASSEQRLASLRERMEAFRSEAEKLKVQAEAAEDEWRRSYAKLRTTRSELQRLAAQVSKSERQAASVLDTLRVHKQAPNAVELRADAAQKLAELKQQRRGLEKSVYRIARLDI